MIRDGSAYQWLAVSLSTGAIDTLPCLPADNAGARLGGGHCVAIADRAGVAMDNNTPIGPQDNYSAEDLYFDASGSRAYFAVLNEWYRTDYPLVVFDSLGNTVLESDSYTATLGVAFNGDTIHVLATSQDDEVVVDSWDLKLGSMISHHQLYKAESDFELGGDIALSLDGNRAYVPTAEMLFIIDYETQRVRGVKMEWPNFSAFDQFALVGAGTQNKMIGYHNASLTTWFLPEAVRSD